MDSLVEGNKQFLADLFAGPFRGHALIVNPIPVDKPGPGDIASSDIPISVWVDWAERDYQSRLQMLDATGHDDVPHVKTATGTQIFAAAFGSPVHIFDDSPPCALPLVTTADEADALEIPDVYAAPLDRAFEFASGVQERLGPEVPITVPDIQSPFDIAALIWNKEKMYLAVMDDPDAVKRLVSKCHIFLTRFLREWMKQFPQCSLAHCPNAWAPAELGCWLSEDEAGAMSTPMFEEFCVPTLVQLSEDFDGIFIHCCATADHQYGSFRKIPNLRGMNRVFQSPGPEPAIKAFSGDTVLMQAWMTEKQINGMLDMALPDTRFLFNLDAPTLDEAKAIYGRMRERCPRT